MHLELDFTELFKELLYTVDAFLDMGPRDTGLAGPTVHVWHLGHFFVGHRHQVEQILDLRVGKAYFIGLEGDTRLFVYITLVNLPLQVSNFARLKVAEGTRTIRGEIKFYVLSLITLSTGRRVSFLILRRGRSHGKLICRDLHLLRLALLENARHV